MKKLTLSQMIAALKAVEALLEVEPSSAELPPLSLRLAAEKLREGIQIALNARERKKERAHDIEVHSTDARNGGTRAT